MRLCLCRDVNRVNEEWFGDSDRMRDSIGLVEEAPSKQGHDTKVEEFAALETVVCHE